MNRTVLGLLILAVVAAVAGAISFLDLGGLARRVAPLDPVRVAIYFGGEKASLLRDPQAREIIEGRHRIELDAVQAGSIEMAIDLPIEGKDCLWPSNMVAVELARDAGRQVLDDVNVFNSPIVFYAWDEVADALEARGLVAARADGTYAGDVAGFAELIASGARWREDLGLELYGPFKIWSTDPARSNSGNIWAGLLATAFNGGVTPTPETLPAVLPRIDAYFAGMGFMETSSGDMFESFLKQGMGSRPIIVGYENQLVEFLRANADYADVIRDRIRVIYPEPTIFASHPLIALTPACRRLADALLDPDLQALAWSEHGFRTGLIGVENDPAALEVAALPATVALVAPMPAAPVMEAIIAAVR